MLRFKENVYGFVYDSGYGNVVKIYNRPLNENEIELINEVLSVDDCLLTNIEDCNDMFDMITKDELESDEEGLNEVFDFV